jgi:hypothetical protein
MTAELVTTSSRRSAKLGSHAWVVRTGGTLTAADQLALAGPLVRSHLRMVAGRLAMLARVEPGRRNRLDDAALAPPRSALTLEAEREAQRRLSPAVLNHSYRTYAFGAAVGLLEAVEVDRELLFAAAMLHDTGLRAPRRNVDFTVASARVARDVAERVGLSTAATDTVRDAITLHHSTNVARSDGAVAYLLSAGAGVDVVGLRAWQLPPQVRRDVVEQHPRLGFKDEFRAAWADEALAVPRGRARFLNRFGAFDVAIRLAPFDE